MKTIAIGIGKNRNIQQAIDIFKNKYKVNIKSIQTDNELVEAILDDEIDAVVRGSLAASGVIREVRKQFPDIS